MNDIKYDKDEKVFTEQEVRKKSNILEEIAWMQFEGKIDFDTFFDEKYTNILIKASKKPELIPNKIYFQFNKKFIDSFNLKKWIEQKKDRKFTTEELEKIKVLALLRGNKTEIVELMTKEQKQQIFDLCDELLDDGMVNASSAANMVDRDNLLAFIEKHREQYSYEQISLYFQRGKISQISQTVINALIRSNTFENFEKIVVENNLDNKYLQEKREYDEKENQKHIKMAVIDDLMKNGIDNLNQEQINILIKDASADSFYTLNHKYNLSKELIMQRENFEKNIIENCDKYSEETVLNVFSSLYFQKDRNNLLLDFKSILDYSESEEMFKEQDIHIVSELYNFLSGKINYRNSEEQNNYINEMQEKCKHFNGDKFRNLEKKAINIFGENLERELGKTRQNIFLDINPEEVDGVNIYKMENLTEKQKQFILLVHSESEEKAKNYFRSQPRVCYSILDENHMDTFGKDSIIFGYFNVEGREILTANVYDGQTNQFAPELSGKNFYPNQLYSIEDFMNKTNNNSYNELSMKSLDGGDVKQNPDYILSYNFPATEMEIELAKKYNLPILYINQEKYENKDFKVSEFDINLYEYNKIREIDWIEKINEFPKEKIGKGVLAGNDGVKGDEAKRLDLIKSIKAKNMQVNNDKERINELKSVLTEKKKELQEIMINKQSYKE